MNQGLSSFQTTFCVHCNFIHTPTLPRVWSFGRSNSWWQLCRFFINHQPVSACERIALLIVFRTMFVAWYAINILAIPIWNTINWPANKKFQTIQYYYEKKSGGNNEIFIVDHCCCRFSKIVSVLFVSLCRFWLHEIVSSAFVTNWCPFIFHRRALLKL